MIRYSIYHLFLLILGASALSSCTYLPQSGDEPISIIHDGTDIGSTLSGTTLGYIDPFLVGIQGLENVKNYKEFSIIFPKVADYIDQLILDGSGSIIFNYKIVDNTIPYLYICKFTLSGDQALIRAKIEKYKTIIPPIHKVNITDSEDVISLFMNGTIDIATLYDILLSPEIQLPSYFTDLIQQRRSSIGTAIADDCSALMLKHEKALFTQSK